MNHLDQSAHHLLAGREVGYHAVAQRTYGAYVVVCLLIHHLCLLAHGNHLVGAAVQGHHRRLVDHNLVVADDNCIGCAKIHGQLLSETKKTHIQFP